MTNKLFEVMAMFLVTIPAAAQTATPNTRPRASDLGLKVGILPTAADKIARHMRTGRFVRDAEGNPDLALALRVKTCCSHGAGCGGTFVA